MISLGIVLMGVGVMFWGLSCFLRSLAQLQRRR